MNIIMQYLTNIPPNIKKNMIENYKIITMNDKNYKKTFLIYDPDNIVLNSQTLMKLLLLKTLTNNTFKSLINMKTSSLDTLIEKFSDISSLLYEDRIFFTFDPYNNFLLNNNTKSQDIKDIISRTTIYPVDKNVTYREIDFSNMINPYGLEKVVFTGGGTKGIIYIGAIIGLLATGQIFYLNHFSGTSVGAMSSMIFGAMTPSLLEYSMIKTMSLREILTHGVSIVERYQEAINFAMERFCKRSIHTFYTLPTYTFYGMWSAFDTIIKNNGLYDPQKSGFQIWYALICKKICHIMKNGLDELIIIKKKDGTFVEFKDINMDVDSELSSSETDSDIPAVKHLSGEKNHNPTLGTSSISSATTIPTIPIIPTIPTIPIIPTTTAKGEKKKDELDAEKLLAYHGNVDFDTGVYEGWELVKFFSFQEYNTYTGKTLVLTGTKTKRIETVYYTHTDPVYKHLSVITAATASMSIPWVFKAPIINDSYNLDGGIFDNYPLTHCDKKIKDRITHYNNKIFGYLIDDKNSVIDAYEIIRELWLVYDGFLEIMNIGYLKDVPEYVNISELFFEIRSEVYKLLYFADVDLETFLNKNNECVAGFNIRDLEEIYDTLLNIDDFNFELPKKGINFIIDHLRTLDTHYRDFESLFKIGRKTDLADVMELAVIQGHAYNILSEEILKELYIIETLDNKIGDGGEIHEILNRYNDILNHLMRNILSYYELKGNFNKSNDLISPCKYFSLTMKNMYIKIIEFEKLTNEAVIFINKKTIPPVKNWISNSVQIALTMISKILTRGSGNVNIDDINLNKKDDKSAYQKAWDYFFHTDMTGILFKYMCIANDRICNDSFNKMRTITLNTYETSTLHFNMDNELMARLIYEGYSKTIKYYTNLLHIMELTDRQRSKEEFIESFELKYKKMI